MTELGNVLKEARESKGLSLDELQAITKIQKRYLLGIEEGDYSMMPGKFYVRAFIKQYAEAVGLEPELLLDQYKNDLPAISTEELPVQLSRVKTKKGLSADTSKIFDILPKILIVVFIIGMVTMIWYLIVKYAGDDGKDQVLTEKDPPSYEESDKVAGDESGNEEKKDEKPEENEKTDEEKQDTEEKPDQQLAAVSKTGSNSEYELKNAEKFMLKVVSTGETWVGVSDDSGKTLFQGILKKGATETWTQEITNGSVTINIGRAPETEIYVNEEKLEYAIPPAEDMTQKITIKFVK